MHNDVIEKNATLAGCILVGTLTGTALVAKTVRRSGARLFQRAIPLTSANASPREDAIRLETFSARDAVRGLLTRVERVSILLPLIACSLLGPILLWQALGVAVSIVYLLFKLSGGGISAAVAWNVAWKFFLFFRWVVVLGGAAEVISACAMFAQMVLVGCCIRYGWKVTSTSVRAREVDPKEGGFLAYCLTIVPSFASILVIYMGGFIVGPLTFLFVPWMFRRMGTKLIAERAELAAAFAVPEAASVDAQARD
jgi:hypothetical protein